MHYNFFLIMVSKKKLGTADLKKNHLSFSSENTCSWLILEPVEEFDCISFIRKVCSSDQSLLASIAENSPLVESSLQLEYDSPRLVFM